jgi:hypothetical protein
MAPVLAVRVFQQKIPCQRCQIRRRDLNHAFVPAAANAIAKRSKSAGFVVSGQDSPL